MSASAFLVVQSALVAALRAVPALASVPVHVNRTRAMARDEQAAILVRLSSSRDAEGPLGVRDWRTLFDIEVVARGATGADPAEAVDEVLQSVWGVLPVLQVAGAIEINADASIDWTFDSGDTPLASALMTVDVLHRTEDLTLTPRT